MSEDLPRGLKPDPAIDAWLQRQQQKRSEIWPEAKGLLAGYQAATEAMSQVISRCPDDSWETPLWEVKPTDAFMTPRADGSGGDRSPEAMQVFGSFWYVAYHAIFFLDIDLSLMDGRPYTAPKPFGGEAEHGVDEHQVAVLPYRVYTKDQLLRYLARGAKRAAAVLSSLQTETAHKACPPGSSRAGRQFGEVIKSNLAHLQEHTAQLEAALDSPHLSR